MAARGLSALVLLTGIVLPVFILGGCSSAQKKEEVWIQMVPATYYTFESPRAYVNGEKLVVHGWVIRKGYFQTGWASMVVIGRNKDGEVVVKEPSPVRMTSRRESFTARAPYQPDLDWTIEIEEGGGFLNRATRKVFDR
jgi:hypothetical protein